MQKKNVKKKYNNNVGRLYNKKLKMIEYFYLTWIKVQVQNIVVKFTVIYSIKSEYITKLRYFGSCVLIPLKNIDPLIYFSTNSTLSSGPWNVFPIWEYLMRRRNLSKFSFINSSAVNIQAKKQILIKLSY